MKRLLILILFTRATLAGAAEPYVHYVLGAVAKRDPAKLEKLLDRPPRPAPLAKADGALLYMAYHWVIHCADDDLPRVLRLLTRALELGADPQAPYWASDGKIRVPAIAAIVSTWAHLARIPPKRRAPVDVRSTFFMDTLLAAKKLDVNDSVLVPWKGDQKRSVPLAQYGLLSGGHDAIYAYFLSMQAEDNAVGAVLMNAPMILAMYGRLELLRRYREKFGPERTAAAFAYRQDSPERYSVMHYALLAVHAGQATVARVEDMLEFLSEHGGRPTDAEYKNSLPATILEMAERYPARKAAYLELFDRLTKNLPTLEANSRRARAEGCRLAMEKPKRLN